MHHEFHLHLIFSSPHDETFPASLHEDFLVLQNTSSHGNVRIVMSFFKSSKKNRDNQELN